MKKVFIDTNILIDLIADRKPFSKFAIEIFSKAENKQIRLYTSSHSIATTYYILKKYIDDKELRQIISGVLEYLHIAPITMETLKQGLKSKHKDFEDALQIISAYSVGNVDCIVTRNIKDFKDSEIPVFTPEMAISQI